MTMDKNFIMKFKHFSRDNVYYLYSGDCSSKTFIVKWEGESDTFIFPWYRTSDVEANLKNNLWTQIPNTIEDMEVGDYVEWNNCYGAYNWTYGKLYQIQNFTTNHLCYILEDDEGTLIGVVDQNYRFYKKAYVELFMKDKLDSQTKQQENIVQENIKPQFKAMKFRIENPQHSEIVQKELFKLGYDWELQACKGTVKFTDKIWLETFDDGAICWMCNEDVVFSEAPEHKLVNSYNIIPVDTTINIEGFKVNKDKLMEWLKANGE